MAKESATDKVEYVLRQAHSDAIGFERSIEDEQRFRTRLNGVNVESFDFRVRGLLEHQIEKLKRLLSELPEQNAAEE
jgi:hypothetical protein